MDWWLCCLWQLTSSSEKVAQATGTFSQLPFHFRLLGQKLLIVADEHLLLQDVCHRRPGAFLITAALPRGAPGLSKLFASPAGLHFSLPRLQRQLPINSTVQLPDNCHGGAHQQRCLLKLQVGIISTEG
eukprot:Skav236486  [mRNA]  locus=scaffold1440:216479:219102:- [translate_table: standard]